MLHLVRIALTRPYTFVVLALLILIVGPLAALRTPIDIFPEIRIPVIAVVWQLHRPAAGRRWRAASSTLFQRALTTTVNDIEHIEAHVLHRRRHHQDLLPARRRHPHWPTRRSRRSRRRVLKQMPPGTTPPLILNYNASTVPIIQLALSGKGLSEQQLFDLGVNVVRTPLVTVPGAAIPYPVRRQVRGRSRSTSTRRRCRRAACPARTSPTRSRRRT